MAKGKKSPNGPKESGKRGKGKGKAEDPRPPMPIPRHVRIETLEHVRQQLQCVYNKLNRDEISESKHGKLVYNLNSFIPLFERTRIEAILERMEKQHLPHYLRRD